MATRRDCHGAHVPAVMSAWLPRGGESSCRSDRPVRGAAIFASVGARWLGTLCGLRHHRALGWRMAGRRDRVSVARPGWAAASRVTPGSGPGRRLAGVRRRSRACRCRSAEGGRRDSLNGLGTDAWGWPADHHRPRGVCTGRRRARDDRCIPAGTAAAGLGGTAG